VQCSYSVALTLAAKQGLGLKRVVEMLASNPAKRFGLNTKGEISEGFDADFVLVNLKEEFELQKEDLKTKYQLSPYIGESFTGAVKNTFVRGEEVINNDVGVVKQGFNAQLLAK